MLAVITKIEIYLVLNYILFSIMYPTWTYNRPPKMKTYEKVDRLFKL